MLKYLFSLMVISFYCCLVAQAQEVADAEIASSDNDTSIQIEPTDSLGVSAQVAADSLAYADSIARADSIFLTMQSDSIMIAEQREDSVDMSEHIKGVLLHAWQNHLMQSQMSAASTAGSSSVTGYSVTPLSGSVSSAVASADSLAQARRLARAVDSLRAVVNCEPFDPVLARAQVDFRMPVIAPSIVPKSMRYNVSSMQPAHTDDLQFLSRLRKQQEISAMRSDALQQFFMRHPFDVKYCEANMAKAPEKEKLSVERVLNGTQIEVQQFKIETVPLEAGKMHADKWHYRGYSTLQMTQTSVSENWYKGGEDNMNLYSDQKLQIKRYDENKITTFETTIEWKCSFYYTQTDTIHPMRVNDNQFKLDVNYGYKAWRKWYYSSSLVLKTPVFNFYNANSKTLKSAFFSPAELNISVGMDYKYEKKNKVSYSLLLAPLSYNMKYVDNQKIDVTKYGIEKNRRVLNQLGATLTSKLEWQICKDVNLSSRLYMFTSYESVLGEFENTFTFKVNRYFSAKISAYPRFDDNTKDRVWQCKEMLTFGFDYVW